jgi:hypothetical protein
MDNIYAVLISAKYDGILSVRLYTSLEDARKAYNGRFLRDGEGKCLLGPFDEGEDITATAPLASEYA